MIASGAANKPRRNRGLASALVGAASTAVSPTAKTNFALRMTATSHGKDKMPLRAQRTRQAGMVVADHRSRCTAHRSEHPDRTQQHDQKEHFHGRLRRRTPPVKPLWPNNAAAAGPVPLRRPAVARSSAAL